MDSITELNLTSRSRKESTQNLVVLWTGEFGHLLMFVMPKLNAIRKQYPNMHITFASFIDDHIYFKDNKGEWTIDEYWGFDRWPADRGCHECKGGDPTNAMLHSRQKADILLKEFGHTKVTFLDTPRFSLPQYANVFKKNPRTFYAMKKFSWEENPEDQGEYIVVYAREKKMTEGQSRNWVPDRWREFMNFLSEKHTVYVCGVEDEAIQFDWGKNVINMTKLKGVERASRSLNLLSNAQFVISDCSGSANLALHAGKPCYISGPSPYQKGFEVNGNYFNVHVKYQVANMQLLTVESRIAGYHEFIDTFHNNMDSDELTVTGKYGKN